MKFIPAKCTKTAFNDYIELFAACFPKVDKFSLEYLEWLYERNPDGKVVGFDAYDGDRLAAHYACIPARAEVAGKEVCVLLSLNTATHPEYGGQGLFTKLAQRTYEAGTALGFDCVYGVANANSTPGFSRKLGFQIVKSLNAKIGVGPPPLKFSQKSTLQFCRTWSEAAVAWRCDCPVNKVSTKVTKNLTEFAAPALFGGLVNAIAGLDHVSISNNHNSVRRAPCNLFIGSVPLGWERFSTYVEIPSFLRPSPLNLIYRSLSGRVERLDPDGVFLSFLDFDAY